MIARTIGALISVSLTASAACASHLVVWEMVPTDGVSGTITIDTSHPAYKASPKVLNLGEAVWIDFRSESGAVWTNEDVLPTFSPFIRLGYGGAPPDATIEQPEYASVRGLFLDNAAPGLTSEYLDMVTRAPTRDTPPNYLYFVHGVRGSVESGISRLRLVPEPTTLTVALLAAACVGMRPRRR